MLTVAGGKLTTCRLMAERAVNVMCELLKDKRPCRTAQEAVPGQEGAREHRLTDRLLAREKQWNKDQIICECELVSRRMLEEKYENSPMLPSMICADNSESEWGHVRAGSVLCAARES